MLGGGGVCDNCQDNTGMWIVVVVLTLARLHFLFFFFHYIFEFFLQLITNMIAKMHMF